MKKIVFALLLTAGVLSAEAYRINGVKEFHRVVKMFMSEASGENLKKLDSEDILRLTVQLSSITLMVDELTDNSYLQGVLSAIESYEESLGKIEDNSDNKANALAYLDDLKNDMINQNKSDLAGGTKAFKFDIDRLSEDDLPLYEAKKEMQKNGQKTWDRYFPGMTRIDADIIIRANELKIEELVWDYLDNPAKEDIEALLLFKGSRILFPALKTISADAMKTMAKFPGSIEFNKLAVDDKMLDLLTAFKSSELRVTGLSSEYNNVLSEKLGERYKKSVSFKKRKKN